MSLFPIRLHHLCEITDCSRTLTHGVGQGDEAAECGDDEGQVGEPDGEGGIVPVARQLQQMRDS